MDFPFAGARMLCGLLNAEGFGIGRKHTGTLMKKMGIAALYRKPNTSKPAPGHEIYPVSAAQDQIDKPNQVWAMDITYIPMAQGFVYLAAVMDWHTGGFCPGGCRSRWRRLLRRGGGGGAGAIRQAGDLQHRPRQPVHSDGLHRSCSPATASPSAWTARAHGATTCSSSGCGAASSTRGLAGLSTTSARPALRVTRLTMR